MNPLMHAIYYTHFIFIMLSYSLHYQNLSTEIKTPSLKTTSSGDVSLNPGPSLINQTSGDNEWEVLKLEDFILSTLTQTAFHLKLRNFAVLLVSLTQLLLGFQNQN